MNILPADILKLLLSIIIGGLIGAEREYRDKAAGFRTIIFICVGATLFTIFSEKLGGEQNPIRIAANIVTGIGFLGAGVILRSEGRIIGLTTASTIWLTAAIGMGIGGGQFLLSAVITAMILVVLWLFPRIEERIDKAQETYKYEITCSKTYDKFKQLEGLFQQCNLHVRKQKQFKSIDETMVCSFNASGSPKNHERLTKMLFEDEEVRAFKC